MCCNRVFQRGKLAVSISFSAVNRGEVGRIRRVVVGMSRLCKFIVNIWKKIILVSGGKFVGNF